jgi:cell division protein FtsL
VCVRVCVCRANLGSTQQKVLFLGGLYFLFSVLFELTEQFERRDNTEVSEDLATFSSTLVFPVALVDTCFYWWIFLALSRTISQLTLRRQPAKLLMYRRFALFLIGSGLVSAFALIYQMYGSCHVCVCVCCFLLDDWLILRYTRLNVLFLLSSSSCVCFLLLFVFFALLLNALLLASTSHPKRQPRSGKSGGCPLRSGM